MFDLVAQLKTDKEKAIALLYERYGKKLYGYSVSQWKIDEDAAWELVYKTLYKVISVIDKYKFDDENRFTGFLFQVFTNYLRNHYRDSKKKNLETVGLADKHEKLDYDRAEANAGDEKQSPLMDCLQKVLRALEDWQRIILLMRAQDYAYEDIAPYVNKPAQQLKVYHLRLKKTVTDRTNECVQKNEHEPA